MLLLEFFCMECTGSLLETWVKWSLGQRCFLPLLIQPSESSLGILFTRASKRCSKLGSSVSTISHCLFSLQGYLWRLLNGNFWGRRNFISSSSPIPWSLIYQPERLILDCLPLQQLNIIFSRKFYNALASLQFSSNPNIIFRRESLFPTLVLLYVEGHILCNTLASLRLVS